MCHASLAWYPRSASYTQLNLSPDGPFSSATFFSWHTPQHRLLFVGHLGPTNLFLHLSFDRIILPSQASYAYLLSCQSGSLPPQYRPFCIRPFFILAAVSVFAKWEDHHAKWVVQPVHKWTSNPLVLPTIVTYCSCFSRHIFMQTRGIGYFVNDLQVLNVPLTSSLALPRCHPNVDCSPAGLVSMLQGSDGLLDWNFSSAQIDGKLNKNSMSKLNLHEWAILT